MSESIAKQEQKLIVVTQGRPAYPTRAKAAFGISPGDWMALVDAVWPSAKTTEAVELALSYCRARGLDPFKRPVHIVPVWDSKLQREVETIWPGIGELRTTASRTGCYAGFDEAAFGPVETRTFKGTVGREKKTVEKEVTFPEWCQVTVYRLVQGQRVPFPGPKVRWLETYSTIGASDVPNEMWATRPYGQLEKCAEAAALRRAFPEEIGGEMIHDEIGRRGATIDVKPVFDGEGSRTERLADRLSAPPTAVDAPQSGDLPEAEGDYAPEGDRPPAAHQQAASAENGPSKSREELVEEIRELLKARGLVGEARSETLIASFGSDWLKVVRMDAAALAVGLTTLRANLRAAELVEEMATEQAGREPGED